MVEGVCHLQPQGRSRRSAGADARGVRNLRHRRADADVETQRVWWKKKPMNLREEGIWCQKHWFKIWYIFFSWWEFVGMFFLMVEFLCMYLVVFHLCSWDHVLVCYQASWLLPHQIHHHLGNISTIEHGVFYVMNFRNEGNWSHLERWWWCPCRFKQILKNLKMYHSGSFFVLPSPISSDIKCSWPAGSISSCWMVKVHGKNAWKTEDSTGKGSQVSVIIVVIRVKDVYVYISTIRTCI